MATCDMGYDHEDPAPEPVPDPVVVETGPNDNDVKIAEIEAAARIETEKIWTEAQAAELEAQNQRLLGELSGIKETLALLSPPEPEPEPVPVPVPIPEAAPEDAAAPPPETGPAPKAGAKKGFF